MYSSGTTGIGTSGAGNVTLVTIPTGAMINHLNIFNTGTTAGFFSVDGGNTWGYIPATAAGTNPVPIVWKGRCNSAVLMKRASSDMSGVFAWGDYLDPRA